MLSIGTEIYFPEVPAWGKVVSYDSGCYIVEFFTGPNDGHYQAVPFILVDEWAEELYEDDQSDSWKEEE